MTFRQARAEYCITPGAVKKLGRAFVVFVLGWRRCAFQFFLANLYQRHLVSIASFGAIRRGFLVGRKLNLRMLMDRLQAVSVMDVIC